MNKNPTAAIFAGTTRRGAARLNMARLNMARLKKRFATSSPLAAVSSVTMPLASVLRVSVLLTYALLAALPVQAKPTGAMDLVWEGVNLFTLLAIIVYFTRKPIAAFFRGAAGRQQDSYQAVRRESEEIAAELEAQKQKIGELEHELESMMEGAKADAEEEGRQMTAATEAQAERIRTQARNQVRQEMSKATGELRAQLADEAVKLAEELIRSRMDDDRRQQLISNYIQQLGAQR